MRFGQTFVMRTAKGKIAVGIALVFFGALAMLAAPSTTDALICGVVPLLGLGFIVFGIRQDRRDKAQFRQDTAEQHKQ